jgi:aminoglycoside phosphotransferase (APT) family kinase protein
MPAIPIDEVELQARIVGLVPDGTVDPIEPLQGGTSSITYWTTLTGRDGAVEKVVVKVAPAGLEPTRNRDVLRQARLLEALRDTEVPVPRVLGQHPGGGLEVPPFFIMSFESGDCVEPNFLPAGSIPAEEVRGRALHAAKILGALHRTDPEEVGLSDEVPKTLQEEVQHWVNAFAVCDEDLRAGSDDVAQELMATVPEQGPTTLIHGDYRLGNTLSEADRVVSVIDWEIWARSDARVDMAWFLMMANPDAAIGRPVADGMPADKELLSVYEESRGTAVQDADWFAALVRYKQAAAGALIARNARRRGEETAVSGGNVALLTSARQLLGTA